MYNVVKLSDLSKPIDEFNRLGPETNHPLSKVSPKKFPSVSGLVLPTQKSLGRECLILSTGKRKMSHYQKENFENH